MALYRERIEKVRTEKCIRHEPDGRRVPIGYFHSVLAAATWRCYADRIQERQQNVDDAVLGHLNHHLPRVHTQGASHFGKAT
jgi:hypothetical protein